MSEHVEHVMHENSLEAYAEDAPHLSKREKLIYGYLMHTGLHFSDRGVQAALGFAERGMVQPRISELIKQGLVEECGSTIDPNTGKRVRLVRAVTVKRAEQRRLF